MRTAKEIKELREEHCKIMQSASRTAALSWIAERATNIENALIQNEKPFYIEEVGDTLSLAIRQWIEEELGALGYTVCFCNGPVTGVGSRHLVEIGLEQHQCNDNQQA